MACTRIHFLLTVCILQLLTIAERQIMDFLGYMWAPILVNFFHIIFVIFGFFGAYQLSAKYIVTYSVWNVIFIGWNAFLVCFYLNVGVLERESDLLNLGTGSYSWFLVNGYGCKAIYSDNITTIDDPYRPRRPESVENCLLDYFLVEVLHSSVQCFLAVMGIVAALIIGRIFMEDDDRFHYMGGCIKNHQDTVVHPMYVSYNSLPQSGGTLARLPQQQHISSTASLFRSKRKPVAPAGIQTSYSATLNRQGVHPNFVNLNGNGDLLGAKTNVKSLNLNGSCMAETTNPLEDLSNYFPPAPIAIGSSISTVPRKRGFHDIMSQGNVKQRNSMVEGEVSSFYTASEPVDDLSDLHPTNASYENQHTEKIEGDHLPEYNSFNRANILVNKKMKSGSFYKVPADLIPRSPNLSSSGRHRKRNQNAAKDMNFCDQVRFPGHFPADIGKHSDSQVTESVRTRSHTQLPLQLNSGICSSYQVTPQIDGNVRAYALPQIRTDDSNTDNVDIREGDVHKKLGQMMRQKRSLRPRSYCSSNYYSELEQSLTAPSFVHAAN